MSYRGTMMTGEIEIARRGTSLSSIFTAQPQAKQRMRDFFSSHIRNKNTRRAYLEAVRQFSAFCAVHGIEDLAQSNRSTSPPSSRTSSGSIPSPRLSNGWPHCGCCSIGWWSARSSP